MSREVAALDRALARCGEAVIVRRPGTPNKDVPCLAKVEGVNASTVRPGSSTSQGNYRAILSPTAILASSSGFTLPVRTNDKIVVRGQERVITFANNVQIGSAVVRIEIDFVG